MRRSYLSSEFPAERVQRLKRGRTVSVCIPARDEAATVGDIVSTLVASLMHGSAVIDELLVVDDGSSDDTAAFAAKAGASVVAADRVLPQFEGPGKGQAMWKGLHETSGDIVVFCDADVVGFDPAFVLGLVGPLLARDDAVFSKGFYDRPVEGGAEQGGTEQGGTEQGGRVTELMARPLISVLFPHLADLAQPLSGECAGRREVLEALPFAGGYAVDLGLVIDVTERFGNTSLVQCDLGSRVHRNRPLSQLGPQALAILQLALARSGGFERSDLGLSHTDILMRPGSDPLPVELVELPALSGLPANRLSA